MHQYAAIFRTGETLKKGCSLMDEIFQQQKDLKVTFTSHLLKSIFFYLS